MSHSLCRMLTAIKNGQMSKKNNICIKKTNYCERVLKSLWDEGLILGYSNTPDSYNNLKVFLKYSSSGTPSINKIEFISKPGRRLYLSSKQLWKLESSQLFVFFTTNKGVRSLTECKKLNIGGEPLFSVK